MLPLLGTLFPSSNLLKLSQRAVCMPDDGMTGVSVMHSYQLLSYFRTNHASGIFI
jgi:hypothetical protein